MKGLIDWKAKRNNQTTEDGELGKGSLFSTGLVAGGALAGVIVALLSVIPPVRDSLVKLDVSEKIINSIGYDGFNLLGVGFFILMAIILYRVATSKKSISTIED